MALDQKSQAFIVAQQLIQAGKQLEDIRWATQKLNDIYVAAGLSSQYSSGAFDGSAIAYFDPTQLATLLSDFNALWTAFGPSGGTLAAHFGDIFAKCSPGN